MGMDESGSNNSSSSSSSFNNCIVNNLTHRNSSNFLTSSSNVLIVSTTTTGSNDNMMDGSVGSSLVRKRCSIDECDEYCCPIRTKDCIHCHKVNRGMRFCSMHANHESHCNQQGFIDHPPEELNINDSNSLPSAVLCVESNAGIVLCDDSKQSFPPAEQQTQEEVVEFSMSTIESKVLNLFEKGFTTSSHSNITPAQKIIDALNHATYKASLAVIARKYDKLQIPDPMPDLSKSQGRLCYLNALINDYFIKYT